MVWLFIFVFVFFFFKQKTAYEMRISDWSSDVCSSDLDLCRSRSAEDGGRARAPALPVSVGGRSGLVHLEQLALAPLDGFLGRGALQCLGVHVGDDVLRQHLGGLRTGRPGIAGDAPETPGDRKSTRLNSSH